MEGVFERDQGEVQAKTGAAKPTFSIVACSGIVSVAVTHTQQPG